MEKSAFKWPMIATAIIGFNASGWAQEVDVGKMEFRSSCAACHGMDVTHWRCFPDTSAGVANKIRHF
jgi:hypothetical protein